MKLTILGDVPSQKNRKIISTNRATGRPFLRSAPAVKEWQEQAIEQLQQQFKGCTVTGYPIELTIVFFYGSRRRKDLDNGASTVLDALVKAEIITDDCVDYLSCITLQYGGYDKINPRCEIFIVD